MTLLRVVVILAAGALLASSAAGPAVARQATSEASPSLVGRSAEDTHPSAGDEPGAAAAEYWGYTYDPANPGWAYRWDPEDEANWVRLDFNRVGLGGPPPDPLNRPVYTVDPANAGYGYTEDPSSESNWISIQALEWLLLVASGPAEDELLGSATPFATPASTPASQSSGPATPPATTSAFGPPPPAGTYELSVNDRVARSAGCCRVWGMYFPLSFPESWRGRTVGITIDNVQWQRRNVYPPLDPRVPPGDYSPPSESGTWEINLYWAPRQLAAGEEFQGSDSCSEPRGSVPCVLVHTAGYWVKSTGWTAEPGRYFLFFRDHDTRYHERRVLSVRFRVSYPT